MKRLALGLLILLFNVTALGTSSAQEAGEPAEPTGGDKTPAATGPTPDDTAGDIKLDEDPLAEPGETPTKKPTGAAARQKSWEDIVVVPRKAFLKKHRLEVAPFAGMTLNDPLIHHYSFGGDLNFYITDVLSIGFEGQYFLKELSERASLVGLQYRRIPTLNRLKYHGALAFGYVPGYGKFGLFNKYIVHWDIAFAAGIGLIYTEIIPAKFGDVGFANRNITPHVGLGARLFVLDWLTLSVTFRDYMYVDKFEPRERMGFDASVNSDPEQVKARAPSQFVQNIMMFVSLGFYIPPSFSYKTPR
jgi:outer membrane beta-barrel protein